jgi:hypothetical protein
MALTDRFEEFLKQTNGLTAACKRAFYAVRIEAARNAWRADHEYAAELAKHSLSTGRWWVRDSPALPLRFQLAYLFLGFRRAQELAETFRKQTVQGAGASGLGDAQP